MMILILIQCSVIAENLAQKNIIEIHQLIVIKT